MTHSIHKVTHPFTISIKPISIETIRLEMHSSPLTAEGLCTICGFPYAPSNIFSRAGWEDTKRTGSCQICTSEANSNVESADEDTDSYTTE